MYCGNVTVYSFCFLVPVVFVDEVNKPLQFFLPSDSQLCFLGAVEICCF